MCCTIFTTKASSKNVQYQTADKKTIELIALLECDFCVGSLIECVIYLSNVLADNITFTMCFPDKITLTLLIDGWQDENRM